MVLSSGYALDRDVGALLRDGVDAFLPKPYGVRALSEVLRRVLDGGIG